jgi:hypothetical protein
MTQINSVQKFEALTAAGVGEKRVDYVVFGDKYDFLDKSFNLPHATHNFVCVNNCLRKVVGMFNWLYAEFPGLRSYFVPDTNVRIGTIRSHTVYGYKVGRCVSRLQVPFGLNIHSVYGQVGYGKATPHRITNNPDEHLSFSDIRFGLEQVIQSGNVRNKDVITVLHFGYDSHYPADWTPYEEMLEELAARYDLRFKLMLAELHLHKYPMDKMSQRMRDLHSMYDSQGFVLEQGPHIDADLLESD